MQEITFAFPKAAILIFLTFFIFFSQFFLYQYRQKKIAFYAEKKLQFAVLNPRCRLATFYKIGSFSFIWLLLCIALLSPEKKSQKLVAPPLQLVQKRETRELIFLIDNSASMEVADTENRQTRLEQAKAIVQEVIAKSKNNSVSVYAFSSTLTAVVPQTLDLLFARFLTKEIEVQEGEIGGTRLATLLKELADTLSSSSFAHERLVIFLSDGGDPLIEEQKKFLEEIDKLFKLHVKMIVVGIGQKIPQLIPHVTTLQGKAVFSQLQPQLLKKIAQKTGGIYLSATDKNSWQIASQILQFIEKEKKVQKKQSLAWVAEKKESHLYYQFPLGLALLLLIGGLFVFKN